MSKARPNKLEHNRKPWLTVELEVGHNSFRA